jgi:hypothetical protein
MDKRAAKIKDVGRTYSNPRHGKCGLDAQEETMQFKHCTFEIDGPVDVIKMDHREVMNAVSMDMLDGLTEAPKFAGQ